MSLPLIVRALIGWLQREQLETVAYLREQNRILKAQLRGRRLLTDDERRRLVVLGERLGRRILTQVARPADEPSAAGAFTCAR